MRKLALLPILLILVAGCAALGVPQADTFNKRVIVANSIVESARRVSSCYRTHARDLRNESW
jgi:hypothetical protein